MIKTEIDVHAAPLEAARTIIETLFGIASFCRSTSIRRGVTSPIGFTDYHAENVVIATGTKPAVSSKIAINGKNIVNSDQVLMMQQIHDALIVVGGGVIGVGNIRACSRRSGCA